MKVADEPSGPSGQRLSQFLEHEVTGEISAVPWMRWWSISGSSPALNLLVPNYTPGRFITIPGKLAFTLDPVFDLENKLCSAINTYKSKVFSIKFPGICKHYSPCWHVKTKGKRFCRKQGLPKQTILTHLAKFND